MLEERSRNGQSASGAEKQRALLRDKQTRACCALSHVPVSTGQLRRWEEFPLALTEPAPFGLSTWPLDACEGYLLFFKHLLCARLCARHFARMISHSHDSLQSRSYPLLTNKTAWSWHKDSM